MLQKRLDVINPDWPLVEVAAMIKARGDLAYADSFCVATAERLAVPLLTRDPEIIGLAVECSCEVVDLRKPKP